MILEIEIDNYRCTFDLYIDVKKLWGGGGGWVYLDYNISSGPFLSYEIEIGDDQEPSLTKISTVFNLKYFNQNFIKLSM